MGQIKNLLKAAPLQVDVKSYFDSQKKLYDIIPVFPFLNEETILQEIDHSIDTERLRQEVSEIQLLAKAEGSIIEDKNYIISLVGWNDYPQLIKLLAITREWAFRNEGGGVGDYDTDEFDDLAEMKQLMIINPTYEHPIQALIGGYRYMEHHKNSYEKGPMGAHFEFSETWKDELWIELGRSFINPYYKERERKESFDYVLHGLGYIYARNPMYKGYFGKVTLYKIYELQKADQFFLAVAQNYFKQTNDLWVKPEEAVQSSELTDTQKSVLQNDVFKGLFILLRKEFQINIVPIMAVYNRMVDLDKMYYFGAFRHKEFGDTTEVGIAIAFDDIYPIIKEKFANQYVLGE